MKTFTPSPGIHGACIISPINSPGFDQTIPTSANTKVLFTDFWAGRTLFDTDGAADRNNSQIITPMWAKWVWITAHLAYQIQVNGAGVCDVHLFRNDAPTGEMFLHVVQSYPVGISVSLVGGTSGWIPVVTPGERWSLIARQTSGGNADISTSQPNAWLSVYFSR